jgi:hypothetical protein
MRPERVNKWPNSMKDMMMMMRRRRRMRRMRMTYL